MLPDAQPSPSCLTTLSCSKMVSSATSTGRVKVGRPRGEFVLKAVLSCEHFSLKISLSGRAGVPP